MGSKNQGWDHAAIRSYSWISPPKPADDPRPATVAKINRLLDRHTDAEVVTIVATLQPFGPNPMVRALSTILLFHVVWPGGQLAPLRALGAVALTHRDQ